MFPATGINNNPSGLVDRKIGVMYDAIQGISDNLAEIKQLSYYMESIFNVASNIESLNSLNTFMASLEFTEQNLTEMVNYLASLDAVIADRSALSTDNAFLGFQQLGELAPQVKQKLISGTGPSVGNSLSFAHGLAPDKILDYQTTIRTAMNIVAKPDGVNFIEEMNGVNLKISVGAGGADYTLRPFKCLITYTA